MSQVQRIIIRTGLEADVPALLTAEMGWDYDKKTLRVGDNTQTPPRIMSTKSTGSFDFSTVSNIILPNIIQANNTTFNGMNLFSLNEAQGIVVRSATPGLFTHTSLTSSDGSLQFTNPNGIGGSIDISLNPDILDIIASFEGVTATYQATAPASPKAGDLWMDSDTGVLYVRCIGGSGPIWLDISSMGSGGLNFTASSSAPANPGIGDEWFNTLYDTLFKRVTNGSSEFWMQIS